MSVADHSVEPREKLAGASNQRNFLGLAASQELLVVRPNARIIARRTQRRHVQRAAHRGLPSSYAFP